MNFTDEALRAAAAEAAERWLDTLPKREDCGHDFSLTFQASMGPLLRRGRRRRYCFRFARRHASRRARRQVADFDENNVLAYFLHALPRHEQVLRF